MRISTELSDSWTESTRFTLLEEKPPDGYTWSGERLTKKHTTSRPEYLWPEILKKMSEAAKRKEKQKWAFEKPKLNNARKWTGICLTDPTDAESKETTKTRRKVGSSDASIHALQDQEKQVRWDLRQRLESSLHEEHEDHIRGKGINSPDNLVHKFILVLQAMKIPCVRKPQWKNNRNNR